MLTKLRESVAAGEDEYLDATIKETLRARPVIVDVARKLSSPAEVGGYELPAGTVRPARNRRDALPRDLFPEPDEFRPERFIDGKADTYTWIPFGGGTRRCVGAAFAQYEMRVILRAILERTELRAPDPKPERVRAPQHHPRRRAKGRGSSWSPGARRAQKFSGVIVGFVSP